MQYQYNDNNQLTTFTDPEGNVTRYNYEPTGMLSEINRPNGISTNYEYNANNWTTNITHSGANYLSSYSYEYDKVGNKVKQIEEDGAETLYQYNDIYQLTKVNYPKDKIEEIRNSYYTPPQDNKKEEKTKGNSDKNSDKENKGKNDNDSESNKGKNEDDSELTKLFEEISLFASKKEKVIEDNDNSNKEEKNDNSNKEENGNNQDDTDKGKDAQTGDKEKGNQSKEDNGSKGNKDKLFREKGKSDKKDKEAPAIPELKMYPLEPDYLMEPVSEVEYSYDSAGNRIQMVADGEATDYSYDRANRLTQAGEEVFAYDRNGNLVEKATKDGTVKYEYTTDNMLVGVYYPDDTGVEYTYDAFRRKISRTETYYDLKDLEKVQDKLSKSNNGKSDNSKDKTNNGNGGSKGKENAITRGDGEKTGLIKQLENPYKDLLKDETTYYLYDGLNVINEYDENGATLAEYQIANGQVLARQMFGFHGRKQQGYEGNIRTRGGLMYYQTDSLGNVMDVTDRVGDTVMKYRYDAFGNLFTQMSAPYNTSGYTGKTYDAKAGLMDYSARWYSPNTGSFTTEDTFLGWMEEPLSLNRYSYVHNNPVNYIDPTGRWQEGDENLPAEAQEQIRDLTDQWYNTTDPGRREEIHQAAEAIRNAAGGSSGSSGGSSGSSGNTMTREEWIAFKALYFNNLSGPISQEFKRDALEIYDISITNDSELHDFFSKYISEKINKDYDTRAKLVEGFYGSHLGENGDNYGVDILLFMKWEFESGRLGNEKLKGGSHYWKIANAFFIYDMYMAEFLYNSNKTYLADEQEKGWIEFIENPNQSTAWSSHNNSINDVTMKLFETGFIQATETEAEAAFIAAVVLRVNGTAITDELVGSLIWGDISIFNTYEGEIGEHINGEKWFGLTAYPKKYPATWDDYATYLAFIKSKKWRGLFE